MSPYILVVDDFADGRDLLEEYLTFRGFRVIAATNGSEALEIVRREPPALVLMDLAMTGMDGWEATRQLKADPQTKELLVVAVTAHAMSDDEGRALAAGADAFVPKPFDVVALADAITHVMKDGRAALHHLAPATLSEHSRHNVQNV